MRKLPLPVSGPLSLEHGDDFWETLTVAARGAGFAPFATMPGEPESAGGLRIANVDEQSEFLPFLTHSEDFRTIRYGRRSFRLSPNQAKVIEFLVKERIRGVKEVAFARIAAECELESKKMRFVFSGRHRAAQEALMESRGGGFYALRPPLLGETSI